MHKEYMLSALEQAQLGRGFCAPNPSVGAVAVSQNRIIAKAYHSGAGLPHAEQLLIQQLPPGSSSITLYVTLEPCNHWGRTPPCVDAIIACGIQRVIYAYTDPNPLVSANHTPKILREHGIEVIHYPLAEIDQFYQSYHYWLQTQKPWLTVKIAQTLDGCIAGSTGQRLAISNARCAEFTHQQRQATDIILTTSRTILQDDPQFTARRGDQVVAKELAILDSQLQIPETMMALQLAKKSHIFYNETLPQPEDSPTRIYHPCKMQGAQLDLAAVMTQLGDLGYHDVWVEAGRKLFMALHQENLVNRTHIYIAPDVLGAQGMNLFTEKWPITPAKSHHWQVLGDNGVLTLEW